MASGAKRTVRGAYIGTGAQLDVLTVGFRPTSVKLKSRAGDEATWQDTMPDASMHKRVVAGTGSFATANGVTPLATGFRIGADADLNVIGERVEYEVTD